jgi:hypothetical protein
MCLTKKAAEPGKCISAYIGEGGGPEKNKKKKKKLK